MENLSKSRYKLGDKFAPRGARDAGVFKITEIVYEQYDDVTYTLIRIGPLGEQSFKVSDSAIDEFYYKLRQKNE